MGLPNYRRSLSAGPHTPLAVLVYPSTRHITAVTSFTGSKSWAVPHRCPLDAESPFASLRCYLAEGSMCCHLNRHYPVLIAHTGSWARPKSSPRLRLSLLRWVFAGCCQSLLDDGPSRLCLCNPCVGAWTPTPQRPSGAFARFFPGGSGLTLKDRRSTYQMFPVMQLQQGHRLEAAVIPLCSGSHAR